MIIANTDAKIATREQAAHLLAGAREDGHVVVLTNGVFDLLHLGHVRYLQEARTLGDLLVVGLNDDQSTRRIKGRARPLVPLDERAVVVAALECVDLVVSFAEDTAEALVAELQPDVYVKGGDYDPRAAPGQKGFLPEAACVARYGGRVAILSYLPGHSTSALVRLIVSRYAK
jgi:D-beta-D-heptose 7-phosphate kinase/D-beta-D-heptose 1-phosphate adenosyltransferase